MAGVERVSVAITSLDVEDRLWRLTYEVSNGGVAAVWLIDDGDLVFERLADRIELSYARAPLRAGTSVFGYFAPAAQRIPAGDSESRSVELRWPLRLNDLWNADFEVDLPTGCYHVAVVVGVAATPAPRGPRPGEAVEAPVLKWQRKVKSEAWTVVQP